MDLIEARVADEETEVDGIDVRHVQWFVVVVVFVPLHHQ